MADHTTTTMNGTSNSSPSLQQLAALLRECANHVERNEFHPDLYQALAQLHTYAGEHANNPNDQDRQVSLRSSHEHHLTFGHLTKKFQKGLGLAPAKPAVNQDAARATSLKNAERIKGELGGGGNKQQQQQETAVLGDILKTAVRHRANEGEWCEEHFCLGCACKDHQQKSPPTQQTRPGTASVAQPAADRPGIATTGSAGSSDTPRVNISSTSTPRPAKPPFQRPVNPNSILIANGWIEQQRRSKMRDVWKPVLASLVEGRKPGEETTLWIQRETTNAVSGKPELEALHQIPLKWLVGVEYLDYSTDHRFTMKVYNMEDPFLFRCPDEESAQNWVLTLRSVREVTMKNGREKTASPKNDVDEWDKAADKEGETKRDASVERTGHRMTVTELRAIAHGAGINTAGMERRELEAAVAQIAGGAKSDTAKEDQLRREEELKRRKEMEAAEQRRLAEEEHRRRLAVMEEEKRKRALAEEAEQRRRQAEAEERRRRMEEERRKLHEEKLRKLSEEEQRRQKLAEEIRRREFEEEEQRRRKLAEEEQRRRKLAEEEQLRRKLAEEEQRRRAAEQQAAEQRRREEEAKRQQWQQQQQREQQQRQQQQQWQYQQQQQNWQQRPPPPPPQPQQQPWQQKQQQPQQPNPQQWGPRAPSPSGHAPPPPPQNGPAPNSPVNLKYAKMAVQEDDSGQAAITKIKHNILIHWALQPPNLQTLRPIAVLITTIHSVFPPAFGVAGHEYFRKWKALTRADVDGPGHMPAEEKLKKSVRKLRFFLHPDKLPRDLNDEQQFMCKMLWDVTSDAWEEFEKHKEDLDWIRN